MGVLFAIEEYGEYFVNYTRLVPAMSYEYVFASLCHFFWPLGIVRIIINDAFCFLEYSSWQPEKIRVFAGDLTRHWLWVLDVRETRGPFQTGKAYFSGDVIMFLFLRA